LLFGSKAAECQKDVDFVTFDPKTGKASVKAPKTMKDLYVTCKVNKTALEGEVENKILSLTVTAPIPSACMLDVSTIPQTIKAGTTGTIFTVKTVLKPTTVPDTAKYCPGDKFSFSCNPAASWATYDDKLGKATFAVPKDAKAIKMTCNFEKKALNGEIEKKSVSMAIEEFDGKTADNFETADSAKAGGWKLDFDKIGHSGDQNVCKSKLL